MAEHRFTVVVHTDSDDELAARMALHELINGDIVSADGWDEVLSPLRTNQEDDAYITLEV